MSLELCNLKGKIAELRSLRQLIDKYDDTMKPETAADTFVSPDLSFV